LVSLSTSNGNSYIFCPNGAKNCPKPGAEIPVRQIRVSPKAFLYNEPDDSRARSLSPVRLIAMHGATQ
jgi:hypothetical protein